MKDYMLTVMARDRVGIVRDVSSALSDLDGNITHLSQTVLRGYFTLIVSVEVPNDRTQLEIRQAIERNGAVGELDVNVRPYDPPLADTADSAHRTERFTLSVQGKDQKGIIARATDFLAGLDINVDDFYSYVHEDMLLVLAQVAIPVGLDLEEVQQGLEQVGKEFGLAVHLQHEDVFRATSDVRPVS